MVVACFWDRWVSIVLVLELWYDVLYCDVGALY